MAGSILKEVAHFRGSGVRSFGWEKAVVSAVR